MTRSSRRKEGARDPGGFVAIPWTVLDSPAYLALSHPARSLLIEIARQYHGDDNGRLVASMAYLKPRGWSSNDTVSRAKRELLDAGLIFETVKGRRPNRASWYALTWHHLNKLDGYDSGAAAGFQRSAYLVRDRSRKSGSATPLDGAGRGRSKNDALTPSGGVVVPITAPSNGVDRRSPIPPDGAIRPVFVAFSTPPDGDPLEEPSAASAFL